MIDTLLLTLEKIFVLFVFMFVGYFISRKGLVPKESTKTLSYIGTNVFFPAYLIKNLSANFTKEKLSTDLPLFLWGIVFLAAVLVAALLLSRLFKKSKIHQNTLIYIFAFSNYGYFGYPVMEKVFGEGFVSKTIVFAITSTIAIASLGYFLLMGKGKSVIKTLLSPTIIAIFIGGALGLSGIKLPSFCQDLLSTAGNCMSPVSMLLTGFVLGRFSLKQMFNSPCAYLVSGIRLALMPALAIAVLLLAGVRGYLLAIPVIVCAMPVGMNTVLFTEAGGRDSSEGARICFISYVMGIITIPIVFAAVSMMM
ncbi:MAG: AEC family transporter [Clostridia bacterium]|nr:AEC family transporter [Clostridia bacterium]